MILEQIQNKPWAIRPAKLEEIEAFLFSRLTGESPILPEAGKSGIKADQTFRVDEDGIAEILIWGTIDKRMNMMSDFSGGTSTELLKRDLSAALDNPKVNGILLNIDSPGGAVDGTKELADFIFANRGRKPIVAYVDGMMASAAYWIGSAADKIIASDTSIIGSIGVALTHYDFSARDEARGVKRTPIAAGKYKRITSDEKPLSQEGKAYLQEMVDTYYSMFVESVARNRGVSVEKALGMADGKEFIGEFARKLGLVDSIGTRDYALHMLSKKTSPGGISTMTPIPFRQTATNSSPHSISAPGTFEGKVAEFQLLGMTKADATREAIRTFPELHHAFLQRQAQPQTDFQTPLSSSAHEKGFIALVKEFEGRGMPKSQAIAHVAKSFPEAHRKYLEEANQKPVQAKEEEKHPFVIKVLELQEKGKTRADAINHVSRFYPKLRTDFVNSGSRW